MTPLIPPVATTPCLIIPGPARVREPEFHPWAAWPVLYIITIFFPVTTWGPGHAAGWLPSRVAAVAQVLEKATFLAQERLVIRTAPW